MSEEIKLSLKMLLPSVAIAIGINYFGISLTPVPTTGIVLVAVFLPSSAIGVFLWWRQSFRL